MSHAALYEELVSTSLDYANALCCLQDLRFLRNAHGKPFLDPSSCPPGHQQLHHNISHTTGLVGEARARVGGN